MNIVTEFEKLREAERARKHEHYKAVLNESGITGTLEKVRDFLPFGTKVEKFDDGIGIPQIAVAGTEKLTDIDGLELDQTVQRLVTPAFTVLPSDTRHTLEFQGWENVREREGESGAARLTWKISAVSQDPHDVTCALYKALDQTFSLLPQQESALRVMLLTPPRRGNR